MNTILLKKGKQEEIKNSYSAGKLFIDTLKTVLRDKMESSWKSSINDFDSINWEVRQAMARGYEKALLECISLLEE